jgi:hypothetical protein
MMVENKTYLLLHNTETRLPTYTNLPAGFRHQVTLIILGISMISADRCLMAAETPLDSRHDAIMVERMMSKRAGEMPELHVVSTLSATVGIWSLPHVQLHSEWFREEGSMHKEAMHTRSRYTQEEVESYRPWDTGGINRMKRKNFLLNKK